MRHRSMGPHGVRVKRVYEPVASEDGRRILVERLWPRGISKERAQLDEWARDLAPTPELRRWYSHAPDRWAEFRDRYIGELRARGAELDRLRQLAEERPLTLVFAASDERRNSAAVLKEVLES